LDREPVGHVATSGQQFFFCLENTPNTRWAFWQQALRALHTRGDEGKCEFIKLLRYPGYADEPRVRRAVREVLRPFRGPPWGWKRLLPKPDYRWPFEDRRALAQVLETAPLIRPHSRPRYLSFDLSPETRRRVIKIMERDRKMGISFGFFGLDED
jgi:hypothetical protein